MRDCNGVHKLFKTEEIMALTGKVNWLRCPFCGGLATLRDNEILYGGRSFGNSYICENYPKCDTYVGVHKATNKPLGTLADAELRKLRNQCHTKFDPLWKTKKMKRKKVYEWLAKEMNLQEAHIAEFTKEQCKTFLGNVNGWLLSGG
jgi:ssDNA-binding Zn-finger/Zn-ribbon topoisomerase 1